MEDKYTVLLADDEEEIRDGMANRLPWEALGFQIIGTAENGVEALEILEKEMPDVVITDIQMPFMDGLEFIEKAMELVPYSKFVVFSGYDVFEYAQKAISLRVAEYILKPFSSEELKEIMLRLKEAMDQEREERRNIDQLRRNFEESLPILRDNFLIGCLSGMVPAEKIEQQARAFNLSHDDTYGTVLFDIEVPAEGSSAFKGEEELFPLAVRQLVAECLSEGYDQHTFLFGEYITVVVRTAEDFRISSFLKTVNEICREAKEIGGGAVTAGVGSFYPSLENLFLSYNEAQEALLYNYLLDRHQLFATYIQDVKKTDSNILVLNEQENRKFGNVIKFGTDESIQQAVNGLFQEISQKKLSPAQYQLYFADHLTALMKLAQSFDLDMTGIIDENISDMTELIRKTSLEEAQQWLIEKSVRLSHQIKNANADSGKAAIQKAKLYIQEHYADKEISAEKVSQALFLSPAYFSSLFKKETGQSVVSYLTDERLKQAVHLLETTDDKTYMISEKVGYTESNYFSYVFKKKFGISPSKYRSQQSSQQ